MDPLVDKIGFRHWRLGARLDDMEGSITRLDEEVKRARELAMSYHILVDGYVTNMGTYGKVYDTTTTVSLIVDLAKRYQDAMFIECWNEVHDAGVATKDRPWWSNGEFDIKTYYMVLDAIRSSFEFSKVGVPIANSATVNYWQNEGHKWTGNFLDVGIGKVVDYFNLHCYLPSFAWDMKSGDKDVFTSMNGYADDVVKKLGSCDGRFRKGGFWERIGHKAKCVAYRARALQWGLWYKVRIKKPIVITEYSLDPLTESSDQLRGVVSFFRGLFKPVLMVYYSLDHLKYSHINISERWW